MEIDYRLINLFRFFAGDKAHRLLRWAFVWSIALHIAVLFLPVRRGLSGGGAQETAYPSAFIDVTFVPVVDAASEDRYELEHVDHRVVPAAPPPNIFEQKTIRPDTHRVESQTNSVSDGIVEYLPPERLTRLPEIFDVGNLELPGVINPGDQGRLVLEIHISEIGRLDAIRVVETSVPGPFLANALRVFNWARYEPGRDGDRAVPAKIRLEIVLEVSSIGASVVRGAPESQPSVTKRELLAP
ncbi:MAG TPA: energy transducer TonB [Rhodocyclaceae bacterium]|nr:energy transducer TonB [Rhodocyclaceae bacterium]